MLEEATQCQSLTSTRVHTGEHVCTHTYKDTPELIDTCNTMGDCQIPSELKKLGIKEHTLLASKMAQWVKALAIKFSNLNAGLEPIWLHNSDDLSLVPRTHMSRNLNTHHVSGTQTRTPCAHMHAHTHIPKNKEMAQW